jgi:hypothetical protein
MIRYTMRIDVFVVVGETEVCPMAKMLAEPRGRFEFSELLRNRCF